MSRKMAMIAAAVCLAAIAGVAPLASAGMVVLADGTSLQGDVYLVGTAEPLISVHVLDKPARSFKISEVRQALFDPKPGDIGSREADGVTWARTQVGEGRRAGSTDINGSHISITDSSEGFHLGRTRRQDENKVVHESFCFVFQKLEGDGVIMARVLPSEATKWMRAGLMICEGLEGDGPMALVSRTADPVAATLITRDRRDAPLATTPDAKNVDVGFTWLKLTRTGNLFQAYESFDGLKWNLVGEHQCPMDEVRGVYIGVAATGNAREGAATFEAIRLKGKRSTPVITGLGDSRLPDVSVTLQDGTVLAGSLESIDATVGQIKRAGAAPAGASAAPMTVPVAALARAQFAALTRPQTEKFLTSTAGLLTLDGDFLDGEIKELKPGNITVSSIAFGLTTMERWRVAGVVFSAPADTKAPGAALAVRLQDGTLIVARKAALEKDQLVLDEPLLGPFKVPTKEVLSIERRGN